MHPFRQSSNSWPTTTQRFRALSFRTVPLGWEAQVHPTCSFSSKSPLTLVWLRPMEGLKDLRLISWIWCLAATLNNSIKLDKAMASLKTRITIKACSHDLKLLCHPMEILRWWCNSLTTRSNALSSYLNKTKCRTWLLSWMVACPRNQAVIKVGTLVETNSSYIRCIWTSYFCSISILEMVASRISLRASNRWVSNLTSSQEYHLSRILRWTYRNKTVWIKEASMAESNLSSSSLRSLSSNHSFRTKTL